MEYKEILGTWAIFIFCSFECLNNSHIHIYILPYAYKDLVALYLEVGRYNDLAGWYLQYDGLSLKKPEIPLGIIGQ